MRSIVVFMQTLYSKVRSQFPFQRYVLCTGPETWAQATSPPSTKTSAMSSAIRSSGKVVVISTKSSTWINFDASEPNALLPQGAKGADSLASIIR